MLLWAALAGCAAVGNVLKDPDVELEQVVVRDVGVRGGRLDLLVGVENPNAFDLRGTGGRVLRRLLSCVQVPDDAGEVERAVRIRDAG